MHSSNGIDNLNAMKAAVTAPYGVERFRLAYKRLLSEPMSAYELNRLDALDPSVNMFCDVWNQPFEGESLKTILEGKNQFEEILRDELANNYRTFQCW